MQRSLTQLVQYHISCTLPLIPPSPRKILVPSGHFIMPRRKVLKRHFCKKTQIIVSFFVLPNIKKQANLHLPLDAQAKCFSFLAASAPDSEQELCPWIPHLFRAHNNWVRSTFGAHTQKFTALLCPGPCPILSPQLQIPSAAQASKCFATQKSSCCRYGKNSG